jgi:hypothetical protein
MKEIVKAGIPKHFIDYSYLSIFQEEKKKKPWVPGQARDDGGMVSRCKARDDEVIKTGGDESAKWQLFMIFHNNLQLRMYSPPVIPAKAGIQCLCF